MKLLHLANFNSTNVGNGALIDGLESTLAADSPSDLQWQREAWDDYTFQLRDFDAAFVDRVNQSDGLIVGGAVTFNGRDYNHRTGSRFELPFELWDELKKPLIFYGLSYRHWPGQTYHHLDRLRSFIDKILKHPRMLLTVRNDGTRDWLAGLLDIDCKAVQEVPDTGLYVRPENSPHDDVLKPDRKNILIAFNDEDSEFRFQHLSREQLLESVAQSVIQLAGDFDLNLVLCPHYFDDLRMISDFIQHLPPRLLHQSTITTGITRSTDCRAFYGRYQRADLVIAMRVHAMSPCIGMGAAMIPLLSQDRMSDFLTVTGLGDHGLEVSDHDLPARLVERASALLQDSQTTRDEFRSATAQCREATRAFHEQIFQLLG